MGFPVGPGSMTPEFLNGVTSQILAKFGLPIEPVGQGATPDPNEFARFINSAYTGGTFFVSAWRYGVTPDNVIGVLRDTPPRQPPPPPAPAVYVVQSGDTLSGIAAAFGVSMDEIIALNNITDPSYLYIGQELIMPGGVVTGTVAGTPVSTGSAAGGAGSGRSYTVVEGDTLFAIAGRYGTTVDAIASLNGLTDVNYLYVGQVLAIP